MGRNAKITIWNLTNGILTRKSYNVMHGKFQKGYEPPNEIKAGKMSSFEVGNRTGSKIGPKGTVTYRITQGDEEFKVIFFWDHPFAHKSSVYRCYSEPLGKISAVLEPNQPKGHNQSITWTVELVSS